MQGLVDDRFVDILEQQLPAHRERLYPPTETLAVFVSQVLSDDRSCQRAVNDASLVACNMGCGHRAHRRRRIAMDERGGGIMQLPAKAGPIYSGRLLDVELAIAQEGGNHEL